MLVEQGSLPHPPTPIRRWPLATKIIASILAIMALLIVIVGVMTFVSLRQQSLDRLGVTASAIADVLNYAIELHLAEGETAQIERLAQNSVTIPGVRRITIADLNGNIIADSDPFENGGQVSDPELLVFLGAQQTERQSQLDADGNLTIYQPLYRGGFGGGTDDIIGVVSIAVGTSEAEAVALQTSLRQVGISLSGLVLLALLMGLVLHLIVVRPLNDLAATARRFSAGDLAGRSAFKSRDEIGLLAQTLNGMADTVATTISSLETQVAERTADLEGQRADLARALEDLQQGTAERLRLADALRALSTPVVRLHEQIILMPLIGAINAERAGQIQASLLEGVERHRARRVILDLTGIPVIDSEVAASLLRSSGAARLLGADVSLVGIGPEVAQSMIHLGVDLSAMRTYADLQSGVLAALDSLDLAITRGQAARR